MKDWPSISLMRVCPLGLTFCITMSASMSNQFWRVLEVSVDLVKGFMILVIPNLITVLNNSTDTRAGCIMIIILSNAAAHKMAERVLPFLAAKVTFCTAKPTVIVIFTHVVLSWVVKTASSDHYTLMVSWEQYLKNSIC